MDVAAWISDTRESISGREGEMEDGSEGFRGNHLIPGEKEGSVTGSLLFWSVQKQNQIKTSAEGRWAAIEWNR